MATTPLAFLQRRFSAHAIHRLVEQRVAISQFIPVVPRLGEVSNELLVQGQGLIHDRLRLFVPFDGYQATGQEVVAVGLVREIGD
jgi:hypothetical protein